MRVILIGSVNSSRATLSKLVQYNIDVVAVFGVEASNTDRISGYIPLRKQAEDSGVPFFGFTKINDQAEQIIALKADLIFVVGLSQLVSPKIVNSATHGCVGFHPTKLPHGRGRAPLAWLVMDQGEGAATFFKIAEGVDDGPIYVQQSFFVDSTDNASRVSEKIHTAIEQGLDRWLPELKQGNLEAIEQDHEQATYNGIRKPADGWLNWQLPSEELSKLVLSADKPHPGAYTYCGSTKIIIWKAVAEIPVMRRGVVGRIQHIYSKTDFVVQTGHAGLLRVLDYSVVGSTDWAPRVGDLLGYYQEHEIHELKGQMETLLERVAQLERQLAAPD